MSYPMFTKQHFIALAGLLKAGGGMVNADQMASFFLMINPKFDKRRFMEAATHIDMQSPGVQ